MTVALTERILMNREVVVEASCAAGATQVDLAAVKWDDEEVDPIEAVERDKEVIQAATGKVPNRLLLSRPVFRGVRNNPRVKRRITGAATLESSKITAEMLAEVFEVDKVVVASMVKGTSKQGQPFTSSYVWGKTALLYHYPKSPGLRTISLGYLYTWAKGRLAALVNKGRLPDLEHSDYVEVMRFYDPKIVAASPEFATRTRSARTRWPRLLYLKFRRVLVPPARRLHSPGPASRPRPAWVVRSSCRLRTCRARS